MLPEGRGRPSRGVWTGGRARPAPQIAPADQRMVLERAGISNRCHQPVEEEHRPRRERQSFGDVVVGEDDRDAILRQVLEKPRDVSRSDRGDPCERLAADEDARWPDERGGELETAALPRGELSGGDVEPAAELDATRARHRVSIRTVDDAMEGDEIPANGEVP